MKAEDLTDDYFESDTGHFERIRLKKNRKFSECQQSCQIIVLREQSQQFRMQNLNYLKKRRQIYNKPQRCKFCDYSCNRKDDLRVHTRTNTGEKPFKCELIVITVWLLVEIWLVICWHNRKSRLTVPTNGLECYSENHTTVNQIKCDQCAGKHIDKDAGLLWPQGPVVSEDEHWVSRASPTLY